MKKFKINLDRPGISDEKILSTKSPFSKMLNSFHAFPKPFYKTTWFAGSSAATFIAGTAILAVYMFSGNDKLTADKNNEGADTTTHQAFVQPPIPGQDIPYETYYLSSNCTQKLTTHSGTCLHIPEGAFVDSAGNKVPLPVELNYREFRNPVDFFVAGIPMTYDSAGTEYTFESAGMLELRAFKDGKEIFLAPGKSITADMKSNNNSSDFNVYYLDTVNRNWVYKGKDIISDAVPNNNETVSENISTSYDTTSSLAFVPLRPVKASANMNLFKMKINTDDFPELNIYDNMLFQVVQNTVSKFKSIFFSVKWTKAMLSRTDVQGQYELTLARNDTSMTYTVFPVFDEKDYDIAITKYNQTVQQQIAENKKREAVYNSQYANRTVNWLNTSQTLDATSMIFSNLNIADRTFDITSMGTWNCDMPMPPLKKDFAICPQFADADNNHIEYENLYIVDLSKNALFSYGNLQRIRCNKKSNNLMWILTPDNKIGIVNPELFSEGIKKSLSPKFHVVLLNSGDGVKKLESMLVEEPVSQTNSENIEISNSAASDNTTSNNDVYEIKSELIINCFPNPFSDKATLQFTLPENNYVKIDVYDMSGKFIQNVYSGNALKNQLYSTEFNGEALPIGTYYYNMTTGTSTKTGTLVHMK